MLAAVDSTKEHTISSKYKIKGYPTTKYFINGEFQYDVQLRDSEKIIEFMKNPQPPPPPPPPEAPWEDEPSNVLHLDDSNFKTILKKKKHVLAMFYAPWCGHCKMAKPEFTRAAEIFKDDPKVELVAIDCTKHHGTCQAYKVQGYPTLKYFSYLKDVKDYDGGRTVIILNFFLVGYNLLIFFFEFSRKKILLNF